MSNKRDLKAFVRYDGSGRVVAGSLILRRQKPKVGKWTEVQGYECCTDHTLTTTVVANLSAANPLKIKFYCGNPSIEKLSSAGWTVGAGWTAASGGYTHTSGTTALSNSLAAVVGTTYRLTVTITGATAGSITVAFGGVSTASIAATTTQIITASTVGNLVITPLTAFNGNVIVSIVQMPAPALTLNSIQATATTVANLVIALNSTYPVLGIFSTTGGTNLTLVMKDDQKQAICSGSQGISMTVTS
jgi:hypothetical protein